MRHTAVPRAYADGWTHVLAEVAATGRLLRRTEREALRDLGERAAEEGVGLKELMGLYLGVARAAWPDLSGTSARQAGEGVLAAVDAAVAALVEGYERAQRLAVRQEEAERREFVDDLLHGRSDLGRLSERAERFGLRLAGSHTVAVAWGPEAYDERHPLARRVERELAARFGEHQLLFAAREGRLVCVAPSGEASVPQALREAGGRGALRVAVGRAHRGPGGVVRSYEEAVGAVGLAERLRLEAPVLRAADLLVFPVLLRDRTAMADLVRTVLGPLQDARGGAGPLLETLAACAASRYVGAEAARRLGLSVRALSYRLERIRGLTGYDPDDPLQRYTLETAAMGARLLDWPARPL
ncbi:helix-turn-helix domain-containing protein [Streptacidiphilus sp. ASG 303]|uniref:PucR family transcriptional regulator n=1 Tax=Streptacidiphilus sp. ASG 303 TaxID=2896847 RepID=UPI001E612115|nr:helix-turn-helix domain-containing protein [Streptacidiphilus sp. ASG 303]MCD0484844.1 helix-turn-helix domain-containing protein [Streptacidiphilus sp. ASG 303]